MIKLLILLLFAASILFLGNNGEDPPEDKPPNPLGTYEPGNEDGAGVGTMKLLDRSRFNWSMAAYRRARDASAESRFDPLFFCINFPNGSLFSIQFYHIILALLSYIRLHHFISASGVEKVSEIKYKRLRRNTPDSEYWMYEPQYHHWNTRFRRDKVRIENGQEVAKISPDKEGIWHWWSSERGPNNEKLYADNLLYQQLMYQNEMRDAVKRRGFYFRTEVTAIKDKAGPEGNILKGWFHLKITLERATGAARIPLESNEPRDLHEDEGQGGTKGNPRLLDEGKRYNIDRLIVSSRGTAWGMGAGHHNYYPSLVYTSGIG
jgi:hypothetical protein